jgi:pimeloyl-ACP methyl ester carboxylesterase
MLSVRSRHPALVTASDLRDNVIGYRVNLASEETMGEAEFRAARRTLLTGAGASIGAAFGAGLMPAQAAQIPESGAQAAVQRDFWTGEYWARKGDVSLHVYRKRLQAPEPGERPLPVLFFVHGSSNSARTSFDLAVPQRGEYSMMNVFARLGYDVWTMDHENYGRSSRTEGNSGVASGVEDLIAGAELVAHETGAAKLNFCGVSSGALRAGGYAMARPERVARLVLAAFTYTGAGAPTLGKRSEQLAYYRTHSRRKRDRAMIRSIFTRDGNGAYDPAVADALADQELKFGEEVPTGTYLDMVANLPLVDPKKVAAPVLLVRGEHDGIATLDDLYDFYKQLPNGDRQFVILPGVAHSIVFANNRHMFWHVMAEFLSLPPRVDT